MVLTEGDPLAKLIKYEDLIDRPAHVVADILRFSELIPSQRTESYAMEVVSADDRSAQIRDEVEHRLPGPVVAALDARGPGC